MRREAPWSVIRGFLMGAADVVPGVSGGTIALVLGIYERLVASVRAGSSALGRIARLDGAGAVAWLRKVEWSFLVPLGLGIGIAIFTLAGLLESLLDDYPVQMAALFFGLIGGSTVVAWKLVKQRDATRVTIAIVVALAAFVVLGLRAGTSEDTVTQIADPSLWAFFFAGAVAICAMILPGISGSFILVLLGMYAAVLASVSDRDVGTVLVVGAGAVLGLAVFSQALHWALARHYDTVMASLVGLMLGSARVLWPWPDGLDSTRLDAPGEAVLAATALAVVAFAAVVALSGFAKRLERD